MEQKEHNRLVNQWYKNSSVLKVILNYLGCEEEFELEKNLKKISDSENLKEALRKIKTEEVELTGPQIKHWKGLRDFYFLTLDGVSDNPNVKDLRYFLNFENPPLEIYQMQWQRSEVEFGAKGRYEESKPVRVLFNLDVEYVNKKEPAKIVVDQLGCFELLEPTREIIEHTLLNYGIKHKIVMTGKGYHFMGQVPGNTPVMDDLIKIGGKLEPTLVKKISEAVKPNGERKSVPYKMELAFKGMCRLEQYIYNKVINQTRKESKVLVGLLCGGDIPESIIFDCSNILRHAGMICTGTLGSPYLKFILECESKGYGKHVVENTAIPIRILISENGKRLVSLRDSIAVRNNYYAALDQMKNIRGDIPDCSKGLVGVISDYFQSDLLKLHQAIDGEEQDDPQIWTKTYRNYEGICRAYPEVAEIIRNPNPATRKPESQDYFVQTLYNKGVHPTHIGGILRALWEEERFGWGEYFRRYDAAHQGNTTVEIMLGQRFEEK